MDDGWRPYGRSDDIVEAEFERGHAAERATADWLRELGLAVVLTPQKIRPEYRERRKYRDAGFDLTVEGRRVEVRHRAGYHFTGPADFPFDSVWFEDNPPWNRPGFVRPRAYACVSGKDPSKLVGFVAVVEEDYHVAFHQDRWDPTRHAIRDGIHVPTRYGLSLEQFVDWVRGDYTPQDESVSPAQEWDPETYDALLEESVREDPIGRLQRQAREENRKALAAQKRREYLALRALEDQEKRQWIAEGNDLRQPEEYRGRVYDVPDKDGVHPTAFPPLREGAGAELTDEFIAFQAHNQTRYETHPEYYCVDCKIRYNARDGGRCGPCLGKLTPSVAQGRIPGMTRRSGRTRQDPPQYPL